MFKNVAAKFIVFAFDVTTGAAKTGDAANITAYVSKDYGAVTVLGDTSAAEMESTNAPGYYLFDAAQAETNADCLMVSGKSSTANISVVGAPAVIYTRPTTGWLAPATAGRTLVVDAAGLADANVVKLGPTGSGTAQTARDLGLAIPAAVAGAAGGLMIAGSNAATTFATLTVTGATTLTGNVLLSDGLTVAAPSTGNRAGISVTGNGTGAGIITTGGATGFGMSVVATGTHALEIVSSAASSHGVRIRSTHASVSDGVNITGGSLGVGMRLGTLTVTGITTLSSTLTVTGNVAFNGAAGLAVANGITANITGNLSGSVGSVTGAVGSVTGAVGSVTGLTASDVGDIKTKTDSLNFTVAGNVDSNVLVVNGVTVTGTGTTADPWNPA